MFAVEKGVPMPEGTNVGRANKYDWDKMEVSDSIFVPESEADPHDKDLSKLRTRVYNAARKYGAPKGKNFKALVREEKRENPDFGKPSVDGGVPPQHTIYVRGVRVWRIADEDQQG